MPARCAAAFLVFVAGAACTVTVDYGGTGYRCADGRTCPAGQVCRQDRCVVDTGGADAPPGPDAPPIADAPPPVDAAPPPPWWDAEWPYRRRLTVENGAAEALAVGFPVGWLVDLTPFEPAGDPYDGVRVGHFTAQGGWRELSRYVDDNGGAAEEWLWFALVEGLAPGASTGDYWLYYGGVAASPAPDNGADVFTVFYDGFSDATGLDTGRWEAKVPSTVTVAADDLVLGPGDTVRTLTTWGPGHAVDVYLELGAMTSARYWAGFQRTRDFDDSDPWLIWIDRNGAGTLLPEYEAGADSWVGGAGATLDMTSHVLSVERAADRVTYRFDGVLLAEHVPATPLVDPLQVRLTNESMNEIRFPRVRVRPHVDPPPKVTMGPEERAP